VADSDLTLKKAEAQAADSTNQLMSRLLDLPPPILFINRFDSKIGAG
jgi:hypothetical protein